MPPKGWKNISIPEKVDKELEKYAKKLNKSKSQLASKLILDGIKRYRKRFSKKPLKQRKSGEEKAGEGIVIAGI